MFNKTDPVNLYLIDFGSKFYRFSFLHSYNGTNIAFGYTHNPVFGLFSRNEKSILLIVNLSNDLPAIIVSFGHLNLIPLFNMVQLVIQPFQ